MLSPEQMKALKQVNVSKDPDKTKQRVKQDFSAANNAQKREIEALSAQKRHSFYRAYNTGSINARLVLAMAQALNVTPYYYTGQEDDKKPFDDTALHAFLKEHGYEAEAEAPVKAKRGRPAKAKARTRAKAAVKAVVEEAVEEPVKAAVKEVAKKPAKEAAKKPAKEVAKEPAKAVAKPKDAAPSKRAKKAVNEVESLPKKDAGKRLESASAQSFVIHLTLPDSPEIQKVVKNMTEDDAVSLLKAMLIREKTGQEASQLAILIKRCLLG